MAKDTMNMISLAAATPAYVETFRYQDGGMEKNVQDEFDARNDHIQVSRVVNWELINEDDYGLSGWTPTNSLNATAEDLVLSDSKFELYIDEGLAYIGGRRYIRTSKDYIDDGTSDPGSGETTYNIYLKYTESGDDFAFDITTATRVDDHLTKYLIVATAAWLIATGWEGVVDLRASNTSLGAPATVSGTSAGAIFTVENTGAGDGLLVKNSDAVIGESGTPQQLVIQGDATKALTIYSGANSVEMVCSAANQMKVQTIAGADAELIVKTLNGMVVGSSIVTTGEWQGTVIAKGYLAAHDHTAVGEGGDYAWADITGFGGTGSAYTVSRSDHAHSTIYYTKTEQEDWENKTHYLEKYVSGDATLDTDVGYPVIKIPAYSTTGYAYYVFRIPDTWNSSTNSKVVFLVRAAVAWVTDPSEHDFDVRGYKEGETPSASWNIYSTSTAGVYLGSTSLYELEPSFGSFQFDPGDIVVARFGGFDGTYNESIIYVYDAYVSYS